MSSVAQKLFTRVTNLSFAFVLALSSLTALVPFLFAQNAAAAGATHTVCTTGCDYASLQDAVDAATDADEIRIESDLVTTSETVIDKPLTIRGLGHTITSAYNSNASNNSVIEIIGTTGVVINNLTIEGAGSLNLHGINVYEAGASINNTRVFNNDKSGIVVNRSDVTLAGITTAGNGWHGVNLDTTNVAIPSSLTVKQVSSHDEPLAIYVDDTTKPVTFTDVAGQYVSGHINLHGTHPNDLVYRLAPQAPQNLHFVKDSSGATVAPGSVVNYTGITLKWDTVAGAERYQIHVTDPNGATQANRHTGWYTFDLDDASRHGHFGTVEGTWQYEVRTKDDLTNVWSGWSTPLSMVFDSVAPVIDPSLDAGTTVGGTHTFTITQTELHPNTLYVEYMEKDAGGVWRKKQGQMFNETNIANLVVDTTNWNDGIHQVKVTSKDKAGNHAGYSFTFNVDHTNPTITVKSGSTYTVGNGNIFSLVSFKLYDANNVAKTFLNGTEKSYSPSQWSDLNFVTVGSYGGVEGDNELVLEDIAGNQTTYNFVLDTIAPVATLDAPSDGEAVAGPVAVRGTVEDENLSHYYLQIASTDGTTVHTQTVTTSEFTNELLYTWDTTGVSDGEYTVFISARDFAENKDGDQTTPGDSVDRITVTIDNTAPDTTISSTTQTTDTPTIIGTVDDLDATVTLTVIGVGTFTLTPDASGIWSQTVGPLPDGPYDIEVFATDQLGNVGATDTALLTVDTTPAAGSGGEGDGDGEGAGGDGDGQPIAIVTPIITPPSANGDQDVQGATDENDQDVEGSAIETPAQVDTDASDGSIFGLAWYWWILILAALTALVWGIIAALRRRQEEA